MFCQLGWMPSSIWRQVAVMISKNSIANTRIDLYQIQCHLLSKNILKQAFKVCSWWQFISFSFFFIFSLDNIFLSIFSLLYVWKYCHYSRSSLVNGRKIRFTVVSFVQFKINFAKHITFIFYVLYTPVHSTHTYTFTRRFYVLQDVCYATLRNQVENVLLRMKWSWIRYSMSILFSVVWYIYTRHVYYKRMQKHES